MRISLVLLTFLMCQAVWAQSKHKLVRRVVVFPLKVEAQYAKVAEDVWWDLRKKLTDNKRFLVASKNFMSAKDVFQPRGELKPADAIILGRLLDAHALISVSLEGRKLRLFAYEGRQGYPLWDRSLELHPSLPVSQQLPAASEKLVLDFMASIPYQGFVITDELIGQALYREGGKWRMKSDIGAGGQVSVGDPIQVVEVLNQNLDPLFMSGSKMNVLADGRVVKVDRNIIVSELDRVPDPKLILNDSLVRLPSELKRLQDTYALGVKSFDVDASALGTAKGVSEQEKERKPLVTTLSWVANLAIFLMIGF